MAISNSYHVRKQLTLAKTLGMKKVVTLAALLLIAISSAMACSCQLRSFCDQYTTYTNFPVIFGRVDSLRDSSTIYFTVFESLRGNIPVGPVLIEDEYGRVDDGVSCWTYSARFQQPDDTIMLILNQGYRTDSLSTDTLFQFFPNVCITGGFGLPVENGQIRDSMTFGFGYRGLDTTYSAFRSMLLSGTCVNYTDIETSIENTQLEVNQLLGGNGYVYVTGATGYGQFNCYNLAGQLVRNAQGMAMDISGLAKGTYIVLFENPQGKTTRKFFIP